MSKEQGEVDLNLAGLPLLPNGWCWVTLSTIAKIDGGITKDQKRQRADSMREVPYLRVANVQRGYLDLQEIKTILADPSDIDGLRLQKGDILFTEGGDRDKLGRGWVWNEEIEDCIHQNHIFRARPLASVAESKFVSFHGNFFGQKWFAGTGKQTTNLASINKGVLSRFPVPLAPFNEQHRIVTKIEELFSDLDAGVAALKRAKANLTRYRAAVLKAAVEGKLTEEWRAKHPNTEPASKLLARILTERRQKWEADQDAKFAAAGKEPPKSWRDKYVEPPPVDTIGLPGVPKSWTWAALDALSYLTGGITKDQKKANRPGMREVPYLRVANVQRGLLDLSEMKSISASEADIAELRLEPGDVLFTEGGDRDKLGRGWVWSGELAECIHQNHIFRGRLVSQELQPRFISHHGNTFGKEWFINAGKQTTNLASINLGILRRFPIPVPPAAEQVEIVAQVDEKLSLIDAAEIAIENGLLRAARLRQSVLKQAFEGKLVLQDSAEEPAAQLLSRIRQQSRPAVQKAVKPLLSTKRPRLDKENLGRAIAYCLTRRKKAHGRTWLAKVLVLGELHVGVPLNLLPNRFPHGPLDDMIFDAERMAKKAGWFKFEKATKPKEPTRYEVTSGTAVEAAKFMELLGDRKAAFDNLIKNFDSLDSDEAELFGTVYTAWNDLLIDGRSADDAAIIAEFYAWDDSKANFTRNKVLNQIAWLRQHDYVPTGKGPRTIVLDQKPKPESKPVKKPRKA